MKKMNLKEFKKVKEEYMKESRKVLAVEFEDFFEKYPEIDAVRWTQYTPYFNDGEPCEFRRYDFDARVNSKKLTSEAGDEEFAAGVETDEDDFYPGWEINSETTLGKVVGALKETFDINTLDLFKSAFGDGVQVTATRKGFKVENYSHE